MKLRKILLIKQYSSGEPIIMELPELVRPATDVITQLRKLLKREGIKNLGKFQMIEIYHTADGGVDSIKITEFKKRVARDSPKESIHISRAALKKIIKECEDAGF